MLTKLVLLLIMLLAIPFIMVAIALVKNDLPWQASPGPMVRLSMYLSHNDVSTSPDSTFPERITRHYKLPSQQLLAKAKQAVEQLGWQLQSLDDESGKLHAVVTSSLFKYKDDVYISVSAIAEDTVALDIRAVSRKGKGDLGTNTRHIMVFYKMMDDQIQD